MPFLNANDSFAKLTEIHALTFSFVEKEQIIASFETTKASIDLEAPKGGWLVWNFSEGDVVNFGDVLGLIYDEKPEIPVKSTLELPTALNITKKAKELIFNHNLDINLFEGKDIVLESDVLNYLGDSSKKEDNKEEFLLSDELTNFNYSLNEILRIKRDEIKARFSRHVPLGTKLNDRWKLAEFLGFGNKSSIYDESLVIGDVFVGENCWIGPFTILDGSGGGLSIGDWTSIGAGTHVYTHHTINQALTGGNAKVFHAKTEIGRNCFVSPNVIISPGTKIGNCSFVAANSFVEGVFPENSYISGSPAKNVGQVIIDGGKIKLELH